MAALTKKSIAAIKKAGHSDSKKPVSEVTDVKSSGCPVRPNYRCWHQSLFQREGIALANLSGPVVTPEARRWVALAASHVSPSELRVHTGGGAVITSGSQGFFAPLDWRETVPSTNWTSLRHWTGLYWNKVFSKLRSPHSPVPFHGAYPLKAVGFTLAEVFRKAVDNFDPHHLTW